MKKTLVAIAALAASAGAFAQSSVTAFGIVDIGFGNVKDYNGNDTLNRQSTGLKDGTMYGNRLGFRGTEDLGNGNTANFWLEAGISPSTGSLFNERDGSPDHVSKARTQQTTRQAWAGVKSNSLGEVRAGYQNTLTYDLTSQRHALSIAPEIYGGTAHNGVSVATRASGVTYFAPVISGIEFGAQWAKATDGKPAQDPLNYGVAGNYEANILGLSAVYKNGPLQAGVSSWQLKQTGNAISAQGASTSPIAYSNTTATTAPNERDNIGTMLAARYDFGFAKLAANYGTGKSVASTASSSTTAIATGVTYATGEKLDKKQFELGVSVPVGRTDLIGSYGKVTTDNAAGSRLNDVTHVMVGAVQNLSARTQLYAFYGYADDKAISSASLVGVNTNVRVGFAHKF